MSVGRIITRMITIFASSLSSPTQRKILRSSLDVWFLVNKDLLLHIGILKLTRGQFYKTFYGHNL